jgi:hypothetical protein
VYVQLQGFLGYFGLVGSNKSQRSKSIKVTHLGAKLQAFCQLAQVPNRVQLMYDMPAVLKGRTCVACVPVS